MYKLSFYGEPIHSIVLEDMSSKKKRSKIYLDITAFRPDLKKRLPTDRIFTSKVVFVENRVRKIVVNYNDNILSFKNIRI